MTEYPNLPRIEERFKNAIYPNLKEKAEECKKEGRTLIPDFEAEVFMQTFSNTAGLFDDKGTCSGQAFTNYYITVMYEAYTGIYGIFQTNTPVYIVKDANQDFLNDLANHELCPLRVALERY